MKFKKIKTSEINQNRKELRKFTDSEIAITTKVVNRFGFQVPIIVDNKNQVVLGAALLKAAQNLNLEEVTVVEVEALSEKELDAFTIAINKISMQGELELENFAYEIKDLLFDLELNITPEELGFSSIEMDNLLFTCDFGNNNETEHPVIKFTGVNPITKIGDLIKLGRHRLYCGDALNAESYQKLMEDEKADLIITDAPYNVKIQGNVTSQSQHKEFVQGSGEMSSAEFTKFLSGAFSQLKKFSTPASLHYLFMDWKHLWEIQNATKNIYSKLLNICVWNKLKGGMGSFYRSQHEFCLVYQNETGSHRNNIQLGKHGRNRTNIWDYVGMNSSNKQAKKLGKMHPTVKPLAMLVDIMLDASEYGDIVLDCFGGSGSTLMAAQECGRSARVIEISPEYCDVIIHRWEELTGEKHEIISREGI